MTCPHRRPLPFDADVRLALDLFVALVTGEPDWREATLDHADARPGGYAFDADMDRLSAVNRYTAEELGWGGSLVLGFSVDGWESSAPTLHDVRGIRAEHAQGTLRRNRDDPEGAARWQTPFDTPEEVERAKSSGDDAVEGAVLLLNELLAELPKPWVLSRVTRSATGGLWAFGLSEEGDLALGTYDVEARQTGQLPAVLWLPRPGESALGDFMDVAAAAQLRTTVDRRIAKNGMEAFVRSLRDLLHEVEEDEKEKEEEG